MSVYHKTIGERIAREFSDNKRHLTDAEQRRLAGMIDEEFAHRVVVVGWSSEYVALIQKHLDACRKYIADRGIEKERVRCERCGEWHEIHDGDNVWENTECGNPDDDGAPCGGKLIREFFEPELQS